MTIPFAGGETDRWITEGIGVLAKAIQNGPLNPHEMALLNWVNKYRQQRLAVAARILTEIGGTPKQLEDW